MSWLRSYVAWGGVRWQGSGCTAAAASQDVVRGVGLLVAEVMQGVAHLLDPAGEFAGQHGLAAGHEVGERLSVLLRRAACAPLPLQAGQPGCGLVVGDDRVIDLQV